MHIDPNHCTPSGVPWIQPSSAAPLAPSTSTETNQCSALQRTDRNSSQEHHRNVQAHWQCKEEHFACTLVWSRSMAEWLRRFRTWSRLSVASSQINTGSYAPALIVLISPRSKPTSLSSRPSSTKHSLARAKRTQEKEAWQWRVVVFAVSTKQISDCSVSVWVSLYSLHYYSIGRHSQRRNHSHVSLGPARSLFWISQARTLHRLAIDGCASRLLYWSYQLGW